MSEKLGFIGLGIMGGGMAANLVRAGFEVTVWNRTASRMAPVTELGASAAGSPREVAERSEVVMICVSDTPDVVAVTEGADGILAGLAPGSVVVDHSTISPSETRRLAGLAEEAECSWLDGPVSGGSEGAALGTLSIMVGGDASELDRVRPYLEAMGTSITHTGPVGLGADGEAGQPGAGGGEHVGGVRGAAACRGRWARSGGYAVGGDRRCGRVVDAGQPGTADNRP